MHRRDAPTPRREEISKTEANEKRPLSECEAATAELMRLYPHLDYLMASTIAWYHIEKKHISNTNDCSKDETTIS